MNIKATLMASAVALSPIVAHAADLTIGFSQIGSESGWRAAETTVTRQEAEKRGIELKFADAQQKQENQIKAIRSFIAQGVDAILIAPVVATGWDEVLEEAQDADIPVILLDRTVDASDDLYLTAVTSDLVHEGKVAGEWLVSEMGDSDCRIVELQGTTGSVAGHRPQDRFRTGHRRPCQPGNRAQPDRRFHPQPGQGRDGKLPQGRGRREHLRALCP